MRNCRPLRSRFLLKGPASTTFRPPRSSSTCSRELSSLQIWPPNRVKAAHTVPRALAIGSSGRRGHAGAVLASSGGRRVKCTILTLLHICAVSPVIACILAEKRASPGIPALQTARARGEMQASTSEPGHSDAELEEMTTFEAEGGEVGLKSKASGFLYPWWSSSIVPSPHEGAITPQGTLHATRIRHVLRRSARGPRHLFCARRCKTSPSTRSAIRWVA